MAVLMVCIQEGVEGTVGKYGGLVCMKERMGYVGKSWGKKGRRNMREEDGCYKSL